MRRDLPLLSLAASPQVPGAFGRGVSIMGVASSPWLEEQLYGPGDSDAAVLEGIPWDGSAFISICIWAYIWALKSQGCVHMRRQDNFRAQDVT